MELLPRIRDELAFAGNIRKSYLYRFLMNFQLWWPIWVIYLLKERGLSYTQITLLDTPFFILIVLAEVPTGAVADRFGRKTSLMLASTLFAVAVFVFGIAQNYLVILVSYTAWGLAQTFQSGADAAILYDSLKQIGREDDFQRINGRLWAVTSFAVLIAMLIGAPIASATSLSFPIVLSAAIGLAAVPVAASMHEPRHQRDPDEENYFRTVTRGIREAWHTPPLRYIILFSGILFMATFAPLIFLQPFLVHHSVSVGDLGLWQAPVRAAGIVSALLTARFVARAGQRAAFLAMPLALGGCYVALAGVDHIYAYAAFLPVGMVAGMQNPVLSSYVNRRIPSERRATILSVQSVVGSMMLAAMEPTGGFVADQLGLRALFLLFGVLVLTVGPAVLWLWNRVETGELSAAGLAGERPSEAVPVS
ncbi:MAG: MFS transporter [Chloroflexota bacterium]|nr:MFS transporter [Chloroflexota bacterium]